MVDSIREKINKNIVETLRGITLENGYEFSMREVYRIPKTVSRTTVFPSAQWIDIDEERQDRPSQLTTKFLRGQLVVWAWEHVDMSEAVNVIAPAVEKALLADHTRGGNAVDTNVNRVRTFLSEETIPYGGLVFDLEIHYRHRHGDPYTK